MVERRLARLTGQFFLCNQLLRLYASTLKLCKKLGPETVHKYSNQGLFVIICRLLAPQKEQWLLLFMATIS